MPNWKKWAALGMVVFSATLSFGSDCDIDVDDDGIYVNVDDDDDFEDFWEDLFD